MCRGGTYVRMCGVWGTCGVWGMRGGVWGGGCGVGDVWGCRVWVVCVCVGDVVCGVWVWVWGVCGMWKVWGVGCEGCRWVWGMCGVWRVGVMQVMWCVCGVCTCDHVSYSFQLTWCGNPIFGWLS